MPGRTADGLDRQARDQLDAEVARHAAAVGELTAGNRHAAVAELNRHLSRVDEILCDHARRTAAPSRSR